MISGYKERRIHKYKKHTRKKTRIKERSTWQRKIVTRREVRAGYEVGGRMNENQEVSVNIEVGRGGGGIYMYVCTSKYLDP